MDGCARFRRIFQRHAAWSALLLLAGGLSSNAAHAQWIVEDPVLIERTMAEYIETAKRWNDEYSHYSQQLIKLQRLHFQTQLMADSFPERDPNYGIHEACPGPSGLGGGVTELFRPVPPNPDDDILSQQRVLCFRLVQAENQQYNETVRMLKRMLQHQRDYQHGIQAQRDQVGESQGALAANDNETSRFLVRMEMDMQYWLARNKAFDTYIATLGKDHGRLAERALGGKKDGSRPILGRLVQAAALQRALSH